MALFIISCGLMQESKDIQLDNLVEEMRASCGLMQESKDIQRRGMEGMARQVVV